MTSTRYKWKSPYPLMREAQSSDMYAGIRKVPLMICCAVCTSSSPANGKWPVIIPYRSTPRLQASCASKWQASAIVPDNSEKGWLPLQGRCNSLLEQSPGRRSASCRTEHCAFLSDSSPSRIPSRQRLGCCIHPAGCFLPLISTSSGTIND